MSESKRAVGERTNMPTWGQVGFVLAALVLAWRGYEALSGANINSGPGGSEAVPFLPPLGWVALALGIALGVAGLIVRELKRP